MQPFPPLPRFRPRLVTSAILDRLRAIVGDKGLILDEQDKRPFVTDWRGELAGQAAAVVRPASTAEVSAVVKLCYDNGIAIVPQGGNTGLMGGATPWPMHRGIVLSLGRMNRVLNVDPVGYAMTVEAGCILQTLQDTAARHDRLFPLSLGAQGSCMIGGNLSTNAGGVQVLRYGNARNLVLGLEIVLANGDLWDGLRALKKDNTGYDLKHLFMGAEGTLGIITKAVLKLWPAPKDVCTAWLAIRDAKAAIDLLSEAHAASDDNVGSCELISRACTDMVLRHVPGTQDPLKAETEWYLLLEWSSARPRQDGGTGMSDKMEQFLADQLEAGRVLDAVIAQTETQSRNMWRIFARAWPRHLVPKGRA
ncbi:FAD/FMN-containing dehydrogenase [Bradyrhizobium sp. LB7.2]